MYTVVIHVQMMYICCDIYDVKVQSCNKDLIFHVKQECVFEDFNLKREVFTEVVKYSLPSAILASSTGNIFPSRLSEGLDRKERIIVAHPVRKGRNMLHCTKWKTKHQKLLWHVIKHTCLRMHMGLVIMCVLINR